MKVVVLESHGGVSFSRDVGTIWEIPNKEAEQLIKAGICRKFQADKDIEIGYKRKLAQLNSLLEEANEVIKSNDRKIKSLTDELKAEKAGAKKTSKAGKKNS